MAYNDLNSALNDLFGGGTPGQTARPDPNSATPVMNPQDSGPQLQSDLGKANDAARSSSDFLGEVLTRTEERAKQNQQLAADVNSKRDAVTSTILDDTESYKKVVQPLFQKQQAIVDKQAELAAMNPLKKFFVSMSGLENNPDYLAQQQSAVEAQIKARTNSFGTLMGIHKTTIDALTQHETNAQDMIQAGAQGDESIARAQGAVVGGLDHIVGEELQKIDANTKVVTASAALRTDTIGQLTLEQTNHAIAQAQKNGGMAVVNGIQLPLGELQERQARWRDINLSLASRDLALQSQQLGLANEHEQNALMHMSPAQLDGIMKNGGKDASGRQFNMGYLAQAYQAASQNQAGYIEQATQGSTVQVYQSALRQIGNLNSTMRTRTADLFGTVPPEFEQQNRTLAVKLQSLTDAYQQTFKAGGPDAARAFIAQKLPELQATIQEQLKFGETMAKKWAGSNPHMAILSEGYFTGTPVNPRDSASALVEMVRSGSTPGKMTPVDAAMFSKIQARVQAYDLGKNAQAFTGKLAPGDKAAKGEIEQDLLSQIIPMMQDSHVADTNGALLSGTSHIAAGIKTPSGQPIDAARINSTDIQQSMNYGDKTGIEFAAKALGHGVTEANLKAIMDEGPNGKTYQAYSSKMGTNAIPFGKMASDVTSFQTQQMLVHLRSTPSGMMGFDPAKALVEAWQHPEFQAVGMNVSAGKGSHNAGAFAIHQVAGGNFSMKMLGYSDTLRQALGAVDMQNTAQAVDAQRKLRNQSPVDTAKIALHSLSGLNQSEADQLMKAVIPEANQLIHSGQVSHMRPGDAIDQVITKSQFKDPQLEKLRKAAAKDWNEHRKIVQKGIAGFLQSAEVGMGDAMNSQTNFYTGHEPVE